MELEKHGIILIAILLVSGSHIVLKYSANNQYKNRISEYTNIPTIVGYSLLFASSLITIFALRYIPFKSYQVYMSLTYLIILVLSKIVLNERITRSKIVGNCLIVAGIFLFNY